MIAPDQRAFRHRQAIGLVWIALAVLAFGAPRIRLIAEQTPQADHSSASSSSLNKKNSGSAPCQNSGGKSGVRVLTDTQGVDFGPYLKGVVSATKERWYSLVPGVARPPKSKKGKVVIQFHIMPDGTVEKMQLVKRSGDTSLDRAAWNSIADAMRYHPLPKQFKGPDIALQFTFKYNEGADESEQQP